MTDLQESYGKRFGPLSNYLDDSPAKTFGVVTSNPALEWRRAFLHGPTNLVLRGAMHYRYRMARDTLLAFLQAVERLLATGIDALPTHEAYQRLAPVVVQLAKKVPTLDPLATLINQLATAAPREQPAFVLHLATYLRTLRGVLAPVGVAGQLEAIPPGPTWAFLPGNVHHVLDAIQKPDTCRTFVLANGIRSGTAFDCRLIEAALDGLKELTGPLAKMLAERVLPAHGAVLLPELRRRLLSAGLLESMYLLRAACRIDVHALRPECVHYAYEPSSLAAEAIRFLLKSDPQEAAAAALEQRFRWQNPILTAGIVRALQHSNDPRAETVLLENLSHPKYGPIAARVLARKAIPDLVERVQRRLKQASIVNQVTMLRSLAQFNTGALQPLREPTLALLRDQLTHAQDNVAWAAGESLLQLADESGLLAVAAQYPRRPLRPLALQAMWALPAEARYDALAPRLEPALTSGVGTHPDADMVFALFARPAPLPKGHRSWDRRWTTLFLKYLPGPRRFEIVRAMRSVGVGHPEACVGLCTHLEASSGLLAVDIATTLGLLGDTNAIAPLQRYLTHGSIVARQACVRALGQLGADAAVRIALSDPYEEVRKTAVKTLVLHG